MKERIKTVSVVWFLCAGLCALAIACALLFGAPVSARAEEGVKQLVNVGGNASAGAVWVEAGLPDTWVGAVEEIRDATQADGGDVILRNDVSGSAMVAGEAAWARTSMNPALGAYAVNGMEMHFYLSAEYGAGEVLKIVFCEKSGWYLNSNYAFQLSIGKASATKASVSVMYKENSTGELYSVYSNTGDVPLYFDYDYFADKAGGFESPVGTRNTIRFAASDGALKLYVNDFEVVDLSGLQRRVLTNISDGVYFNIWSQASNGKLAMRITDIKENELNAFETGAPDGYALIGDDGQITHMLDKMGNAMVTGKASAGYDYHVRRNTTVSAGSLALGFRLRAENTAAVALDVELAGASGADLTFAFVFTGNNAADATVFSIADDNREPLGTARVTLYRDGRVNKIVVQKAIKYFVTVNGENVSVHFEKTNAAIAATGDATPQFKITADAAVSLYGVTADAYALSGVRTLSGYLLDNMLVYRGENPIGLAATDSPEFRARYIATKVDVKGFGATVRLGDYAGNGIFRMLVTSRTDGFYDVSTARGLILEIKKTGGLTMLTVYANAGDGETLVRAAQIDFDWEYDIKHTVSFGGTGEGYVVAFDGTKATFDKTQCAQIDKVFSTFDGTTAQLQFVVGGTGVLFYPHECGSFPVSTGADGWRAGGVGGFMNIGHSTDGVRVRFGEGSAVYDTPVPLDGFSLSLRAYHNFDKVEAYVVLGASEEWYRSYAGVAFSLAYLDDVTARIRVYVTDRINDSYTDKAVASADLPFAWNNGLGNRFDLRCDASSKKWSVYVNGTALVGDYSDEIAKVGAYYTDNAARLQLWGNGDVTLELTDVATQKANTAPAATGDAALFAAIGDANVSLDLDRLFSDSDGDVLYFRLAGGDGYIDGNVWYGSLYRKNTVTVIASDGRGGECEYTFTLAAQRQSSGCGSTVTAVYPLLLVSLLLFVCAGALMLYRRIVG